MGQLPELLLGGALFLFCFCGLFSVVSRSIQDRRARLIAGGVLFFICLCIAVFVWALCRITGNAGLALYAILAVCCAVCLVRVVRYLAKNFRALPKNILALFVVYLFALAAITLLTREGRSETEIRMELFAGIRKAVQKETAEPLFHGFLNLVLFMPMGFLLPCLDTRIKGWQAAAVGGMISTLIETAQLLLRLGVCDIDDIIANVAGAMLGLLVFRITRPRCE